MPCSYRPKATEWETTVISWVMAQEHHESLSPGMLKWIASGSEQKSSPSPNQLEGVTIVLVIWLDSSLERA